MGKGYLTLAGFILFILGMAALALMLVGVQFSFLTWIDSAGRLFGLIVRLVMVVLGLVFVAVDRMDWRGER